MDGIFSTIPNSVKIKLLTSKEAQNEIVRYFLRYAPLQFSGIPSRISDDNESVFSKTITDAVTGKSIVELIELTMQLARPYWQLDSSLSFQNVWKTLNNDIICAPPAKIEDVLRDDLEHWMAFSLFYTSFYLYSSHVDKTTINKICYPKTSNGSMPTRKFNQRLEKFYGRNPLFLHAFFPIKSGKIFRSNKNYIETKNLLDLEIISRIISSDDANKNSFLFSDNPLNHMPNNPLRLFSTLTLSPDSPSLFLQGLLEYEKKTFPKKCNIELYTIYNHYFLERISCMNYMASLSTFFWSTKPSIYRIMGTNIYRLQELIDLSASPLLHFRLRLLDFIARYYPDPQKDERLLSLQLRQFIEYHLRCTIPLMDVLMHLLVGLMLGNLPKTYGIEATIKNSQERANDYYSSLLEERRISYFSELLNQENIKDISYYFRIEKDSKTDNLIPVSKENPKTFFEDKDHSLQYTLYSTLFNKLINLTKTNFLEVSVQEEIRKRQQEVFQNHQPPIFQMQRPETLISKIKQK